MKDNDIDRGDDDDGLCVVRACGLYGVCWKIGCITGCVEWLCGYYGTTCMQMSLITRRMARNCGRALMSAPTVSKKHLQNSTNKTS